MRIEYWSLPQCRECARDRRPPGTATQRHCLGPGENVAGKHFSARAWDSVCAAPPLTEGSRIGNIDERVCLPHPIPRAAYQSWLRIHVHAGGRIVKKRPVSMIIAETLENWRNWTGLSFDSDGPATAASALTPGARVPGAGNGCGCRAERLGRTPTLKSQGYLCRPSRRRTTQVPPTVYSISAQPTSPSVAPGTCTSLAPGAPAGIHGPTNCRPSDSCTTTRYWPVPAVHRAHAVVCRPYIPFAHCSGNACALCTGPSASRPPAIIVARVACRADLSAFHSPDPPRIIGSPFALRPSQTGRPESRGHAHIRSAIT